MNRHIYQWQSQTCLLIYLCITRWRRPRINSPIDLWHVLSCPRFDLMGLFPPLSNCKPIHSLSTLGAIYWECWVVFNGVDMNQLIRTVYKQFKVMGWVTGAVHFTLISLKLYPILAKRLTWVSPADDLSATWNYESTDQWIRGVSARKIRHWFTMFPVTPDIHEGVTSNLVKCSPALTWIKVSMAESMMVGTQGRKYNGRYTRQEV